MIDINDLIFTGRGSTALWSILKVLNAKKQYSKILVPVNICEIVIPVIKNSGFEIVFYDVDASTGNSNLTIITSAYDKSINALLVVHNFGTPLEDIEAISGWAKKKGVFLIEDACNSLGAFWENKDVGLWGDASIFSFGYAKIIECKTGGAVLANDAFLKEELINVINELPEVNEDIILKDKIFQKNIGTARMYSNFSELECIYKKYLPYLLYRLNQAYINEIEAAYLTLKNNLKKRKEFASYLRLHIKNPILTHRKKIKGDIYWRYTMLVDTLENKVRLIQYLRDNDQLVSSWYPPINHLFDGPQKNEIFAGAKEFGGKVINLFVDHRMDDNRIVKLVRVINKFE